MAPARKQRNSCGFCGPLLIPHRNKRYWKALMSSHTPGFFQSWFSSFFNSCFTLCVKFIYIYRWVGRSCFPRAAEATDNAAIWRNRKPWRSEESLEIQFHILFWIPSSIINSFSMLDVCSPLLGNFTHAHMYVYYSPYRKENEKCLEFRRRCSCLHLSKVPLSFWRELRSQEWQLRGSAIYSLDESAWWNPNRCFRTNFITKT